MSDDTVQIENTQENQSQANSKEMNFRALEAKYRRELEEERRAREEAERKYQESQNRYVNYEDDDDDDDGYVDAKKFKKLKKELQQNTSQYAKKTEAEIERKVREELEKKEIKNWFESHKDYEEVVSTENCQYLIENHPQLARIIESLPQGFQKQQLAYETLKNLASKSKEKEDVQNQIYKNQHGAHYHPSGHGTMPYSKNVDFSQTGQKKAYEKMMEMKRRMGG